MLAALVVGLLAAAALTDSSHHHGPRLLTPGEEGRVVVKEVDVTQPGEIATGLAWVNGAYRPIRCPVKRYQITYADGGSTQKVVQGKALDQLPEQDPALANLQPTDEQFRQAQDFMGEHPKG